VWLLEIAVPIGFRAEPLTRGRRLDRSSEGEGAFLRDDAVPRWRVPAALGSVPVEGPKPNPLPASVFAAVNEYGSPAAPRDGGD